MRVFPTISPRDRAIELHELATNKSSYELRCVDIDSKMGDEVWRVLLGEGMLATCLSFGELTRLARLNRSSRRLHDAAWRAIWRARSKACSGAELAHILRLAITKGKVAHVRELVRPMTEQGDASVLMQAIDGEPSYLFLAVKQGSVEVVRALLEAGGRELLMLTADDGSSCLSVARRANQGEVFRMLEVAFQNAGLSSHEITILKR